MRALFSLLLTILLAVHIFPSTTLALERHIHARAGGSSAQQLPLIVAKDLGLFEKYGLDVDLLEIRGGSLLMQALIGQSVNSADVGAQAPIRAILSGANALVPSSPATATSAWRSISAVPAIPAGSIISA